MKYTFEANPLEVFELISEIKDDDKDFDLLVRYFGESMLSIFMTNNVSSKDEIFLEVFHIKYKDTK